MIGVRDLTKMPLFVRSGAVIPMRRDISWIEQGEAWDPLYLHIYPNGKNTFSLYEDDGVSLDYQEGLCSYTEITVSEDESGVCLTVGKAEGTFWGKSKTRKIIANIFTYTLRQQVDMDKLSALDMIKEVIQEESVIRITFETDTSKEYTVRIPYKRV